MPATDSVVTPAMCGEVITLSSCSSVLLTGVGSMSNTSRPAPARCPDVSAACSAGSSMMPPRAVLTMNAPRFMRASRAALNMPTVSAFFGQWMETKSARGSAASRSVTRSQPAPVIFSAGTYGS